MMRMRATLRRRSFPASASRLALAGLAMLGLAPACGDDGGGGAPDAAGDRPDGSPGPDSGPDATPPDAMPAVERAGTIVISEVVVTGLAASEPALSGAEVDIRYVDPKQASVPAFPAGATAPVVAAAPGECVVWVYDDAASEAEPAVIDEGAVTIGGTLSPIGTCAYDAEQAAYACQFAAGTVPANAVVGANPGQGTATILWLRSEFVDKDVAGMFARLAGFANQGNNGTFAIQAASIDSLTVANPAAATETLAADGSYTILAGAGPTPAEKPFLDDTSAVLVGKAAGPQVAGFADVTLSAPGQGLQLLDTSAQLHALPDTPEDVKLQCGSEGDDRCGATPEGATTLLVLTGRTTDASLTGAGATDMPKPTGKHAVFECRSAEDAQELTLPQAALQVILDTEPTRIEAKLLRVVREDDVEGDPANPGITTEILVGHGLVGYTDVPEFE